MKQYVSDTAYSAISHALAAGAHIGLQIIAIRASSLREYGQFAAALAIVLLAEAVFVTRAGELALQTVAKRWLARDYAAARAVAASNTKLDMILNVGVYVGLVATAMLFAKLLDLVPWQIAVLGLTIPLQSGYAVSKAIFLATSRIREQAYFESATAIIAILVGGIAVWFYGIPGLVVATAATAAIKTILAFYVTEKWWPAGFRASWSEIWRSRMPDHWWRNGAPSIARNAFASGSQQADLLIMSAAAGAEATAVYKAAKMISHIPLRVLNPLWAAVRPRLLRALANRQRAQIQRLLLVPAAALFGLLIVCSIPAWFWADDFIVRVFGPSYAAAVLPMMLLVVGNWMFGVVTAWYTMWVVIEERRLAGTMTYAFLFGAILAGCAIYGVTSPVEVAMVVMVASLVTSAACWLQLYLRLREMEKIPVPLASHLEASIS